VAQDRAAATWLAAGKLRLSRLRPMKATPALQLDDAPDICVARSPLISSGASHLRKASARWAADCMCMPALAARRLLRRAA